MRVTHSHSDILMIHHLQGCSEIYPLHNQVRAKGMSKIMEAKILYPCPHFPNPFNDQQIYRILGDGEEKERVDYSK